MQNEKKTKGYDSFELQWNLVYRKVIRAARDQMYKESKRERNPILFTFAIINYMFIKYATIIVFLWCKMRV